jgi:hypothetical protein
MYKINIPTLAGHTFLSLALHVALEARNANSVDTKLHEDKLCTSALFTRQRYITGLLQQLKS